MNYCCRNSCLNNSVPLGNINSNNTLANRNTLPLQESCTNDELLDSLCCCIGKRCSCEFEIDNRLEKREGILDKIGSDYLILRSLNQNKEMYCSLCNLRFVTVTY